MQFFAPTFKHPANFFKLIVNLQEPKASLTKNINKINKDASVDDLRYINKLLNIYFESK